MARGKVAVEQGRGATVGIQIWDPVEERYVDHSRCTVDEANNLGGVRDEKGISRAWRARAMFGRGKIIACGDAIHQY